MNILPGNMRFGAGQPIKRLEDQRLLTGKGQFIDDRPEDGALWLHVLRSPHAHAKIISLDTKAAAGMPDVKAVSPTISARSRHCRFFSGPTARR
jgi:aerobic carbon-monoxide dehydrogenase large subunit